MAALSYTKGLFPQVKSTHVRWNRPGRTEHQSAVCAGKGFKEKPATSVRSPQVLQPRRGLQEVGSATPPSQQETGPAGRQQPGQISGQRPQIQEVPEVVNERLLNRILLFSGLPVIFGFLLFPFFIYLQTQLHVELPTGTVFAVTGLTFGLGLLGISYGVLSASWDENEEGSLLGIDEFKQNAGPFVERVVKGAKDKR